VVAEHVASTSHVGREHKEGIPISERGRRLGHEAFPIDVQAIRRVYSFADDD
jgi:hypothetical protein